MNRYVKQFLLRGLIFGGFGPLIAGVVFWCISLSVPDFSQSGGQILCAVVSTYLLAFVQAGASVFNQIEHWPLGKSLLCHLSSLYLAYVSCYLVNRWLPLQWQVIAIFTAVFAAVYFVIWLVVCFSVKLVSRRLNQTLNNREKRA